MDLFEKLDQITAPNTITDLKDLSSEFMSTQACCEEGSCCVEPA